MDSSKRAFSFGKGKSTPPPAHNINEEPSPARTNSDESSVRQRTVTASSYASTATPPRLDDHDLELSLGGDFSESLSWFAKRKSAVLDVEPNRNMSQSPVRIHKTKLKNQGKAN
jgi:hypothetical protein